MLAMMAILVKVCHAGSDGSCWLRLAMLTNVGLAC